MSSTWPPRMVAPRAGSEALDRPMPKSIHAVRSQDAAAAPSAPAPAPSGHVSASRAHALHVHQVIAASAPRPASTPASTPTPAPAPVPPVRSQPEDLTVPRSPTKRQKARTSAPTTTANGAGPQFQVGCVLLAAGAKGATRGDIGNSCGVSSAAISQALWYMRKVGRITTVEDVSRLTPAGRAWVNGGANLDNQQATRSPTSRKPNVAHISGAADPMKPGAPNRHFHAVAVQTEAVARVSFRCAVFSDGGFFLEKNGARIDLEADEHRAMLRYLDRMAEPAAA